jgi:phosphomannomutase
LKKFIFDVDGTLTPSRKKITPEFFDEFFQFTEENDVYLVTGSDRDKTLEQITPEIYNNCKRVYNCSGSDVYEGDKNVYRDDWELPEKVERFLQDELDFSQFPIRNGNHIERRPGGVNFSILGRDKDPMLGREEYVKWNKIHSERRFIALRILDMFPDLTVALGGQTGIDIGPLGADKSQILRDFTADDEIHFFGDRMESGGNDHSLGEAVKKMGGFTYNVDSYKDTRDVIISSVAERDNTTKLA